VVDEVAMGNVFLRMLWSLLLPSFITILSCYHHSSQFSPVTIIHHNSLLLPSFITILSCYHHSSQFSPVTIIHHNSLPSYFINLLWKGIPLAVPFGAFAKPRKVTISFVISVCLSVRLSVYSTARLQTTTRLLLRRIFLKFHIWAFGKICREN
jgi:hypothetical protein